MTGRYNADVRNDQPPVAHELRADMPSQYQSSYQEFNLHLTADGFTNLREGTDTSPEEVPGPSQATPFTARRASERSERGVTTRVR